MALNFEKFAMQGNKFLKELAQKLGYDEDTERAGRILRAVLHVLRDQLTLEESIQMLAQLPMFLKAVYVEGWTLRKNKKKIRNLDDFRDEVRAIDKAISLDMYPDPHLEKAISVVFRQLAKYVSPGELEDMKAVLPKGLKSIIKA
ncbi:DUF2267 domain-containing protein [Reichenbachiella sp. MALMAid0571]|uniref:DUF2267 domain-containing protein n=1 Tax=Reichenbachiella sp. MALMAid0571 TaxID=3143939 RepID=UPI0032DFAADA